MDWVRYLWAVSLVAELAVLFRTAQLRLFRRYRWFTALLTYLVITEPLTLVRWTLQPSTYALTWIALELPLIGLRCAVAYEAARILAQHYDRSPKQRFAYQLFGWSLAGAVVGATLSMLPEIVQYSPWHPRVGVQWVLLVDRISCGVLSLWLLAVCWPGLYTARRNDRIHALLLIIQFAVYSVTFLAIHLRWLSLWAQPLVLAVSLVCYGARAVFWSKAGEQVAPSLPVDPAELERQRRRTEEALEALRRS